MLNAQLCRPYREITCCRNPTIHSTTLRSNNNTNTVYKQLGRPYSPLLILNDDWYYYRTSQLLQLATQCTEVLQENTVSFEQPCTPARPPNCHIATATPQLASNTDIAGFSPLRPSPHEVSLQNHPRIGAFVLRHSGGTMTPNPLTKQKSSATPS